jgi:dethiobiotin synthetase
MKGLFVTGTDTGVGKTWVTTALITRLRSKGINAAGMKPVECGGNDDAKAIWAACGGVDSGLTLQEVNPLSFPDPLSPAAARGKIPVDLEAIRAAYDKLADRFVCVVVEGAGGWLVPIDRDRTMADLAKRLDLPVLIVAANRLGVLNHALLTVDAIKNAGLACAGIFLNHPGENPDLSSQSNASVLLDHLPETAIFEMDVEGIVALF